MTEHVDLLSSVGICISVAAALAFIGNWMRQPLLLAYLLAGVLIGPQIGLGSISDQASIQTVSEIGLILLLFIIGLELDLNKLMAAGKPVLITGLLQFPLCAALGSPSSFRSASGWAGGDFGLLYVAVCLAISSTMIVVKLLYDKFELDTLPGRITLGVLIFQDIWAIVVLGIQPNLLNPQFGKLLGSLGSGVLLVAVTLVISKTLLPRLFRSVAKLPELVLIGSLAWCFIVCAAANAAGLSREMGALIAGIAISTFPYNLDVVAKVVSIRDFFVTLFFVALGMQIPMPTPQLVAMALLASAFLVASRFIVVFPILRALRQGHRASLLPAINLAQMSEFSMVIAAIGLSYQHIDRSTVSLLIFVFAITSVASTYLIGYSHPLQETLAGWLRKAGLDDLDQGQDSDAAEERACRQGRRRARLFHRGERARARVRDGEASAAAIGCSSSTSIRTSTRSSRGAASACKYGDVASMQTLHHAEVHDAKLVVSTIPDSILKGTSNLRLLQQARRLCPHANVVVTANRAASALELYDAGADFVFVSRLHSAAQMASILEQGLAEGFEHLRAEQIAHIRKRDEVLK